MISDLDYRPELRRFNGVRELQCKVCFSQEPGGRGANVLDILSRTLNILRCFEELNVVIKRGIPEPCFYLNPCPR